MDYGNLFSRAWRICWNNKYLFLLGFLAALGSGGSSGSPNFNYTFSGGELPPAVVDNAERLVALAGPILAALLCVGLILGLVLWLVRLTAQAGLISSAARLDRGETSSLRQSLSAGGSYLMRFVGLNLLVYLPFLFIGAVSAGVGVAAFGAAVGSAFAGQGGQDLGALPAGFAALGICVLALLCLLAPLLAVATVIYAFAQRGIVLQDMGVTESMGYAWRFIREHVGDVILLIVFLIVLSLVYGALVAAVLVPLSFLAFGPSVLDMLSSGQVQWADIAFITGGAIVVGLIAALLNSIFVSYRSVTVTLAYQDLLGKGRDKIAEMAPSSI